MRGLSADEAAQLSNKLYQATLKNQPPPVELQPSTYQHQQQNPHQYRQPESTSDYGLPSNDDWINDPNVAQQRLLAAGMQQINPQIQAMQQSNAAMARDMVRRDEPEMFERYGPEIDLELQRVDISLWSVDNIRTVVDIVRGRHYRELATADRERWLAERGQTGTTIRSSADAPGTSAVASDELDLNSAKFGDSYRRLLERHRITPAVLDEFLTNTEVRKRGISLKQAREEWLKRAEKGDYVTEEEIHW